MENEDEDSKFKSITISGGAGGTGGPTKGGAVRFHTGDGVEPLDISIVVQKLEAGLRAQERDAPQTICSGRGMNGGEHGEIHFCIGAPGTPTLRIDGKGVFWLNGKEIGEDREILVFFRAFLSYVAGGMNRRQDGW